MDKPVIIHCRNAFPDLLLILREIIDKNAEKSPGVVHCFTGTAQDAAQLIELGFFLGVDGPVTYPSSKALRETLAALPVERLVIETDSPYLPPQGFRGQRNEPAHLPLIGEFLGQVKGVSTERISAKTAENARTLFRIGRLNT